MAAPENPRIIVALDVPNKNSLETLVDCLSPGQCRLKVGKELFTAYGPDVIRYLRAKKFDVFLDLKFHDIPNTAAMAVKVAAQLGVWMVNVHVAGGRQMMMACREVLRQFNDPPLLIGVTVLTSLDTTALQEIGFRSTTQETVTRLAVLAESSGLDGVVCSAQEAGELRKRLGSDFCLVTPGIRPAGTASDDQARIVTPAQAIVSGSHYLVVGRPISRASDPAKALFDIAEEVASVQSL